MCRSIEALCEQIREEVRLEVELKKDVEYVCKLMRTQCCDEHTAMDMLKIPKERREAILQAIQKEQ